MTPQPFQLDPEVEHILREVAKDPNSSLLRVERPKVIRGLFEREPAVGVATAGLTSAERHLVQTRRAEVALALRALCLHKLLHDPRAEHLVSRQGTVDDAQLSSIVNATRSAWSSDSRSAAFTSDGDMLAARRTLERPLDESPRGMELAAIAHRLEPTDISRLYAANWLLLQRQLRSSIGILQYIQGLPCTALMSAVVQTNLGSATHQLGQMEGSLTRYREASSLMPTYLPGVVGWLVIALQLGNETEALEAGRSLEHVSSPNSPEFEWQCRAEGFRRTDFQARLTRHGRIALPRLRDAMGPTARILVDALH